MRHRIVTAIAACSALAVSAWTIGWLKRSSEHADRPPLFAIAAFLVAVFPQPDGSHYWWEIMLPGTIVGLIVGYATQVYGKAPTPAR